MMMVISFSLIHKKTKVDQNCYTDLLKTSLLRERRRLYTAIDFVFKTLHGRPRKSDATAYTTEHSRLRLLSNGHHILQILIL